MAGANRICLTFDNLGNAKAVGEGRESGPRPDDPALLTGYPMLLTMLADRALRATFFCEGWALGAYPDVAHAIVAGGHEIALHGWQHERWSELDVTQAADCLDRAMDASASMGIAPRGFRAPGGELGAVTAALLVERGLTFDASLAPLGASGPWTWLVPGRLVNVPFRWEDVDYFAYEQQQARPEAFVRHWRARLDAGGPATFIGHVHVSLLDADRRAAMEQVLDLIAETGRTVTAGEAAAAAAVAAAAAE